MSQLVTIFGGSGFVGRYIARRMAKQGWRVRVAVRRPNEAGFVRTFGVVGQVEPVLANIRDDASVAAAVREAMPEAVILRPSIIFGAEDQFFNRFAGMTGLSPVLPVVGAETRFQPVYVDDVAKAAEAAILGRAEPGIYELGGPDVATFRELMQTMLGVIRRRRLVVGLPFWVGRLMGAGFDALKAVSLGLIKGPITRDQVRNLRRDNVVSDGARGFADLGITPTDLEVILPTYLWRFRDSGQYSEIKQSAQQLKG